MKYVDPILKLGRYRDPILMLGALDAFREEDHPRGQPGNAGQFGSGGGNKNSTQNITSAGAKVAGFSPGVKARGVDAANAKKKAWRADAPKTVEEVAATAAANQKELRKVCTPIAEKIGLMFADPGPKSFDGIVRKVNGGKAPDQINDAVRGGFDVPSPEAGDRIVDELGKRFEVADEGWVKTDAGYFDRKVMVRFENGQVGEVQMWPPGMLEAKEHGGGHKLYEKWRVLPKDSPDARAVMEDMIKFYSAVEERLPTVWSNLFGKGGSG